MTSIELVNHTRNGCRQIQPLISYVLETFRKHESSTRMQTFLL